MTIFLLILWFVMWLIPIGVNIYIDKDGKKPNYFLVFIFRAVAAIAHGIVYDLFFDYFPTEWSSYNYIETFLIYAPILFFQVTSFWILFELGLNIVRGRELLYFDRKENDSGWIDQIFDVLGNGAHLIAKIFALIICILSIMSLYHHSL